MFIRSARLFVSENWLESLQPRVDSPVYDNFLPNYRSQNVQCPVPCSVLTGIALTLTVLLSVSEAWAQQNNVDLDGDGVVDALDLDQDNDGIIDSLEGALRLEDLSGLDAVFFAAVPDDEITSGPSREYDLISTENGRSAVLAGRVLGTDTGVEWTMYDTLPRLRNLGSGRTTVQWSVAGERQFDNIDLTISDLDGTRDETITVSASSIVGYSLSLNSNVQVNQTNGQFSFTGTGAGGDSIDDLVTLHFRNSPLMVISYENSVQTPGGNVTSANSEIDIAGYRHSLDQISSTFYTPVNQFRDTDGDGVSDHRDLDSDNDGLGDVIEAGGIDADNNNLIDGPVDLQGLAVAADPGLDADAVAAVYFADSAVSGTDSDGDGLLSSVDGAPLEFGGSLAGRDSDSDGLSDLDEVRIFQTNPDEPDSDRDGLSDQSEVQQFLTNPRQADTDDDGLIDGDEVNVYSTDPSSADSDADGTSDGAEVEQGTDPLQAGPAIVGEPQPVMELEPVVGSDEGAAPIVNSSEADITVGDDGVIQGDAETPTGIAQFDEQGGTSLRTGPGCSIVASETPEPLMLLMLLMAILSLARNVNLRENR